MCLLLLVVFCCCCCCFVVVVAVVVVFRGVGVWGVVDRARDGEPRGCEIVCLWVCVCGCACVCLCGRRGGEGYSEICNA